MTVGSTVRRLFIQTARRAAKPQDGRFITRRLRNPERRLCGAPRAPLL
jgi:hypothetical protein